jgi:plasmid stabilization system protein ParE
MSARRNKLVYLAPAAQDMEEIVKFHLTRVGAQSARGIYEQMKKEIGRLASYPLLGQTHPDPLLAQEGFRKLVLTDTYVAVYKVIDGEVVIYRIVNGRTDYPRLLK